MNLRSSFLSLFLCFIAGRSPCEVAPIDAAAVAKMAGAAKHFEVVTVLCDSWGTMDDNSELRSALKALAQKTDLAVSLMTHADPKVRTMAMVALFETEQPRYLPLIAGLLDDNAITFPERQFSQGFLAVGDGGLLGPGGTMQEKRVKDVAVELLKPYLAPGRFSIWPGNERNSEVFARYWESHKDRSSCLGWWMVRLHRASGGSIPVEKERYARIDKLRDEIAALPSPDRELVPLFLWTGTGTDREGARSGERWLDDATLLSLAKNLGRGRLLAILSGKVPSDDPDFAETNRWGVNEFILGHAKELLEPGDADLLLKLATERHNEGPACAIAAAQLVPTRAAKILNEAMERSRSSVDWDRARLAAALWKVGGEKEIPFLVEWFYSMKCAQSLSNDCFGPFTAALSSTGGRPLLAAIGARPEFAELGYGVMRQLVETANRMRKEPLVTEVELRAARPEGVGGKGGLHVETLAEYRLKLPKEAAKLDATLTEWRRRLQLSAQNP